jgi:uncharacterized caspase-like protein
MADNDWAIVVGIEIYPGFDTLESHLDGPDNDAQCFSNWLIEHAGVPSSHVILIKTSNFLPQFLFSWEMNTGVDDVRLKAYLAQKFGIDWAKNAKIEKTNNDKTILVSDEENSISLDLNDKKTKVILQIDNNTEDEFIARMENGELKIYTLFSPSDDAKPTEDLIRKSAESLRKGAKKTGYIGRRLYIYMAGHGFAPRDDQTALLMANATKINVGPPYHWLANYTADWFYKSGYFDEIILFADCCRVDVPLPGLNMPWNEVNDSSGRVKKRFYAYATGRSMTSREDIMPDGLVHGIFTYFLLEGLKYTGYQPDPDNQNNQKRVITTSSLRRYLIDAMRNYGPEPMTPEFVLNEALEDFEIATLPLKLYPVTVHLPPNLAGKSAEILNGSYRLLKEIKACNADLKLDLEKGLYAVRFPAENIQKLFSVSGTGEVDVKVQ